MRTYGVEEVTVVAYHQHGMFKVREIFFQPCHGVHIKVVCRLVEQQIVRISEQGLCQHHADLFFSAEIAHQHLVLVFLDAQSAQQDGCVAFRVPSFHFSKLFFQFGRLDSVFIGEVFFCIQGFALFHDVPQYGMSHEYGIEYGMCVEFEVVLTQYRQAFARSQCDSSFGRFQFSGYDFQKC